MVKIYREDFKTLVISTEDAFDLAIEVLHVLKVGHGVISIPFVRSKGDDSMDHADAVYINILKK